MDGCGFYEKCIPHGIVPCTFEVIGKRAKGYRSCFPAPACSCRYHRTTKPHHGPCVHELRLYLAKIFQECSELHPPLSGYCMPGGTDCIWRDSHRRSAIMIARIASVHQTPEYGRIRIWMSFIRHKLPANERTSIAPLSQERKTCYQS